MHISQWQVTLGPDQLRRGSLPSRRYALASNALQLKPALTGYIDRFAAQ